MTTFIVLLAGALALLLLALATRQDKPRPGKRRAAVYLVSEGQLLVMQSVRGGKARARFEVPKGKVERGESSLEAAYRECLEESGLRPTALQFLASITVQRRKGKKRRSETWDAYWGALPPHTPASFEHRVTGDGRDRGRTYWYVLVPLEAAVLQPPLDVPLPTLRRLVAQSLSR